MKKFIITEEEKKRILLLYEGTKDVSESVVIANKNPFNESNSSILSGKTISSYNSSLQNGDLFYTIKDFEKLDEWVLNAVNNLLEGKSLRLYRGDSDKLTTIPKFNECFISRELVEDAPSGKDYLVSYSIKYWSGYQFGLTISEDYTTSKIKIGDDFYGNANDETNQKIYEILKNNISWKNVPDEYFEIRVVQKKTTDFK
jgi:hypothetical protein